MPWVSRLLRGQRVFVRARTSGALLAGSDGRVDVVYKPGGKVYRAAVRNLAEDPAPQTLAGDESRESEAAGAPAATAPAAAAPAARAPATRARTVARSSSGAAGGAAAPASAVGQPLIVYADGACTGNPGPCGIGVVILDGGARRELSEYLGIGTNNIAELTAIIRALEEVPRDRTVILHSDSAYSLGLLDQGWKARANVGLVQRMRSLAAEFSDLRLVKVAGHAGIVENERADRLARDAVVRRR
jgi:ribonuclease HI